MKKLKFTGKMMDFAIPSIVWVIAIAITMGLVTPLYLFWCYQFFIERTFILEDEK